MGDNNRDRAVIDVQNFDDVVGRIASFQSFSVAGNLYSADYLVPQVTVNAADLIGEAASTSAFSLYWGLEASRARRFVAQVSAAYRSWRDRKWVELKNTVNEETGKYPTDKQCDQAYRADPDYGRWRGNLDDAQQSAEQAEAVFEAFKIKSEMIKAAERILAHEAGGSYVVVEANRKMIPRQPQQAPESGGE